MAELQKSFKASSLLSVSLVLLLWVNITARPSMAATPIPVGVILDLNSTLGKIVNNILALAVKDYYSDHSHTATKIHLIVKHVSQNNSRTVKKEASDLIEKDEVHAILGPQNPEQARFIVKLGEESQVPVIWFPMTGPSLLPPLSTYSHQGLHCFQFQAIADVIKALGWHSIIPVYEDTEYGSQLISCLPNFLKEMGIRMVNVIAIDSDSTDSEINITLDKLNKMRPHVFVVHMNADFGTTFIVSAQEKGMMNKGYAWILTQGLSSLTDPHVTISRSLKGYMQGALGVRPKDLVSKKTWVRRYKERDFRFSFGSSLSIYGWWAYHTIEALAMALEKQGTHNNGTKLRSEILRTHFTGKSGVPFDLRKGQLDQSAEYEVYNVIGQRERIIGNWSPKTRLVQNYNDGDGESAYDVYQLEYPLWPGDTMKKPPKLKIGVTRTNSFPEFVNVDCKPRFSGFAVNVFLKAVDVLPFPLNYYEFVPLSNKGRSDTPMYDDILCNQMKAEDLDAIIGDITIVAHRTNCVDFTVPYLDSNVAMMVRVKNASTSKDILLKPFKWSLWLILGGIFATASIIIIILESYKPNKTNQGNKPEETNQGNNPEETNQGNETNKFRSNPFLVYKTDVMKINSASKAAGWMVILTSFLFTLVVQVYTANLTSILTQGKMREPSFKDENDIINRSNVHVGYRSGSWVRELLIEQIRFEPSRLKALKSREEYYSELSKGTEKGGVDAIFDETPYLTLFLSKYKSDFMMKGSIYKTGGFAFAFPKKSSLASHFSNAILTVVEDVEPYRVLKARSSLPTSMEDWEFVDQRDEETPSLSITNFGGFYPVLLSVVALLLGLAILKPSMIQKLRYKKLPFKLAKPN